MSASIVISFLVSTKVFCNLQTVKKPLVKFTETFPETTNSIKGIITIITFEFPFPFIIMITLSFYDLTRLFMSQIILDLCIIKSVPMSLNLIWICM